MLKWTKKQKNMCFLFATAILLAVFFSATTIPTVDYLHLYDLHTFTYAGIVIAWGFLVHLRIVNPMVRRHLVNASIFMLFLLLCRLVRWRCFRDVAIVQEYSWYAYYVSFIMVPLCALYAALCIGKTEEDEPLRRAKWLLVMQVLLAGLAFTNSFHELFFRYLDKEEGNYEYGIVYYVCVAWGAILTITAFVVIVKKCRLKAAKRYWFIPVAGMLFGAVLIVLYYANGSNSPKLFGFKLYNLQEVFCLTFILPFEIMIQLGILPNNSRYDLLFANSDFAATILSEGGETVFTSKTPLRSDEKDVDDLSFRRNEKKIRGGSIVWDEDLSVVHRIEKEIREATEKLEEENELIRQENEIRAERIRYETENRLYDKIAGAVHDKAVRIDEILSAIAATPQTDSEKQRLRLLQQAAIMGAYVKRMGNLMLIAEESPRISTRELGICMRESLEYFSLTGNMQSLLEKGEKLLPARLVLLAYELFEEILENPLEPSSIIVWMDARDGFLLRISYDTGKQEPDSKPVCDYEGWRREELSRFGASVHMQYVDDVWRVQLEVKQTLVDKDRQPSEQADPSSERRAGV